MRWEERKSFFFLSLLSNAFGSVFVNVTDVMGSNLCAFSLTLNKEESHIKNQWADSKRRSKAITLVLQEVLMLSGSDTSSNVIPSKDEEKSSV